MLESTVVWCWDSRVMVKKISKSIFGIFHIVNAF